MKLIVFWVNAQIHGGDNTIQCNRYNKAMLTHADRLPIGLNTRVHITRQFFFQRVDPAKIWSHCLSAGVD